ncbi:hypothetical protein, partial [Mycetohabitans endofungorum]|uniref:hypothetical protein n=1 Tax=Mycetohabitans endofungorum TaxID=417203 RepID=UPI001E63AD69
MTLQALLDVWRLIHPTVQIRRIAVQPRDSLLLLIRVRNLDLGITDRALRAGTTAATLAQIQ